MARGISGGMAEKCVVHQATKQAATNSVFSYFQKRVWLEQETKQKKTCNVKQQLCHTVKHPKIPTHKKQRFISPVYITPDYLPYFLAKYFLSANESDAAATTTSTQTHLYAVVWFGRLFHQQWLLLLKRFTLHSRARGLQ